METTELRKHRAARANGTHNTEHTVAQSSP